MNSALKTLEKDFAKRPKWLQDAAARLLVKGALSKTDIEELAVLCKAEVGIKQPANKRITFQTIPAGALEVADTAHNLRVDCISGIKGVNALAPKNPLVLGATPVSIVYGPNGSGKSGYARMMKHVCGAKAPPLLFGNVFETVSTEPACNISYTLDGATKSASWAISSGPIDDLRSIPIYDTTSAGIYVNAENEVTFEPTVLRLFRLLVEASGSVEKILRAEIGVNASVLPRLPNEYLGTEAGTWYTKLAHDTTKAEVDRNCGWTAEEDADLLNLQKRVVEKSPTEKARALRRTKERADALRLQLETMHSQLSVESFNVLKQAKADAQKKRGTATTEAKRVFENSLDGIGTETWQALWRAARCYSEEEAYRDLAFPHTADDAQCLLCQRPLDADSKDRLQRFELFVKGQLEKDAASAEKVVKDKLTELERVLDEKTLVSAVDAAGIEDDVTRDLITAFAEKLTLRRSKFIVASDEKEIPTQPTNAISVKLCKTAASLEKQAIALEQDATTTQKAELKKAFLAASARKWVGQQHAAIASETMRLTAIRGLEEASAKTHTKWLSDTKAALSETLVTEAFIKRFDEELKALRASQIQVELRKTRAPKGQVFHQVLVKGAKRAARPSEVLSEGQFRIVSIAAFLADVESKAGNIPLVFDDPVSSLDEDFEVTTAQRLIALSKHRQVIVFTHRLSMLSLIQDIAEKAGVATTAIAVRHESWGAGEPNPTMLSAQKPDKALKVLLAERLKKAREILTHQGQAEYDIVAKALCSDIRIIVERLVETFLLNEVVQRFRRGIQTLGRIEGLAKITANDCKLIDDFMTKYSFYEHSQPDETPGKVPPPDEIEKDLNSLIKWCEEFKKRPTPVPI